MPGTRSAVTLALAGWVLLGGLLAGCGPIVEPVTGESPQAKVQAYVRSISSHDEPAALNLWELPGTGLPAERTAELAQRCERITHALIDEGIRPDTSILGIEWWRTCCEPGVTQDARDAGGARLRVQLVDARGGPQLYIFDVFTREPYWGAAADYPPRQWILRDVYPLGQDPLFWTSGR